jgi:hypothetical protein
LVHSGVPGSSETAQAIVSRVLPALDPVTRRIPVELRVQSPPPSFRAHSYVKATVSASQAQSVPSVPSAAVVARPDFCVMVQRAQGWVRVPVRVLAESGEQSLVSGELAAGETVALYPPSSLGSGG